MQNENGERGLWLRNVATGSDTQVVAPAPGRDLVYPTFSPDGNSLYFLQSVPGTFSLVYDLMHAPLLGGAPQVVVKAVDSNAVFSPDGKNVAYGRQNVPPGKWSLFEANATGSGEKLLASDRLDNFPLNLAWSPDGRRIAFTFADFNGSAGNGINMFDFSSGKISTFVKFSDKLIFPMVWAPDGRTIYVLYIAKNQDVTRAQIGAFGYPDGRFRPITNDALDYASLSLSADGTSLATAPRQSLGQIDILPGGGNGLPTAVSGIPAKVDLPGFDFTPEGRLLVAEGTRLIRMQIDGSNAATIVEDPVAFIKDPTYCTGGNSIAWTWFFHGGDNSQKCGVPTPTVQGRAHCCRRASTRSGVARRTEDGCILLISPRSAGLHGRAARSKQCPEGTYPACKRRVPLFPPMARLWLYSFFREPKNHIPFPTGSCFCLSIWIPSLPPAHCPSIQA